MTDTPTEELIKRYPWRAIGIALAAGAILALLPKRLVRKVAVTFAREAAFTYVGDRLGGADDKSHGSHAFS